MRPKTQSYKTALSPNSRVTIMNTTALNGNFTNKTNYNISSNRSRTDSLKQLLTEYGIQQYFNVTTQINHLRKFTNWVTLTKITRNWV